MNFEKMAEIAEWLNRSADAVKLEQMKELRERYLVTFWGHYSAGKSRLINNILEKDILPVQSRETTAVLTYLQYGEEEHCRIFYKNGSSVSLELDRLKGLFQNASQQDELSEIDHVEAYINCMILKSGMVLVDTPGVNTIIKRHQDLAVDAIEQSGKIIYVLGNSPSNADRQFISQITDSGIGVVFVRTKCDKFLEEEEDVELSLETEKEKLSQYVGKNIRFIPVSNENENRWAVNIEEVRNVLRELAENMSEEMKIAIEARLEIYRELYKRELLEEKSRLENLICGETDNLKTEIEKRNQDLRSLEELEEKSIKEIEEKVKKAHRQSERELADLVEKKEREFGESLESIQYTSNAQEEVQCLYEKYLSRAFREMQQLLNSYFDEILKEEHQIFAKVTGLFESDTGAPSYAGVQQDNARMIALYSARLQQKQENIRKIQEEIKKLEEKEADLANMVSEEELDAELERLEREKAKIPTDMVLRVSEDQGVLPSEVFRRIGTAADLALLLIPGSAIMEGMNIAAEAGGVVGKVASGLAKADQALNLANKVDSVRDGAYLVNQFVSRMPFGVSDHYRETQQAKKERELVAKYETQVQQGVDCIAKNVGAAYDNYREQKREGNVLDMITVAYWAEKLGRCFDPPVKMEVDRAEEAERNRLRREIAERQRVLSEKKMQKRRERNLITSKAEELEMLRQEEMKQEETVREEMERKEIEIQQTAQQQAIDKFINEYENYYAANLEKAAKIASDEYFRTAAQNITMYAAGQNAQLCRHIEEKRSRIASLLEMQEKGNPELQSNLTICCDYLRELEEAS